jgi:hypothetical protein
MVPISAGIAVVARGIISFANTAIGDALVLAEASIAGVLAAGVGVIAIAIVNA